MSDDLIILEPNERARFIAYMEQEAASYAAMAKQMELTKLPTQIIEREQSRAAIYAAVAKDIRAWEPQTL